MGCQPTKCAKCSARVKACTLKEGLCPTCYAAKPK